MYCVSQTVIAKTRFPELYDYLLRNAMLAKNLRNAALFRVRQHFTARNKETLSSNEQQVQKEVQLLQDVYGITPKTVLTYHQLEKLMRVTENPDFFSGLPMQTAQWVLKDVVHDFKSWLASLKTYRKDASQFLGRPNMPHYQKKDICTFVFTNQDAVLYLAETGMELKLPKTKLRVRLPHLPKDAVLKEVKVKPFHNSFLLLVTLQVEDALPVSGERPYACAIDFGVHNLAAIVSNDSSCLLYKGGVLKAENQWFNKERARLFSELTKGKTDLSFATSGRLQNLSRHRECFLKDQMHKISKSIVAYCVEHKIGTMVLGENKDWKQHVNIGAANNQSFVSMPLSVLRQMIAYKAERAGILVIHQEESYTSKADFLSMDAIPVYGKEETPSFSGRRIHRGLYRSQDGTLLNADINGAANILRKAFPNAFDGLTDFSFLERPSVYGFHEVNPASIPIKRIEAA